MRALLTVRDEHDKIAQCILILLGSNVQKTELETSDVVEPFSLFSELPL